MGAYHLVRWLIHKFLYAEDDSKVATQEWIDKIKSNAYVADVNEGVNQSIDMLYSGWSWRNIKSSPSWHRVSDTLVVKYAKPATAIATIALNRVKYVLNRKRKGGVCMLFFFCRSNMIWCLTQACPHNSQHRRVSRS